MLLSSRGERYAEMGKISTNDSHSPFPTCNTFACSFSILIPPISLSTDLLYCSHINKQTPIQIQATRNFKSVVKPDTPQRTHPTMVNFDICSSELPSYQKLRTHRDYTSWRKRILHLLIFNDVAICVTSSPKKIKIPKYLDYASYENYVVKSNDELPALKQKKNALACLIIIVNLEEKYKSDVQRFIDAGELWKYLEQFYAYQGEACLKEQSEEIKDQNAQDGTNNSGVWKLSYIGVLFIAVVLGIAWVYFCMSRSVEVAFCELKDSPDSMSFFVTEDGLVREEL